jgi:hypothetical protein
VAAGQEQVPRRPARGRVTSAGQRRGEQRKAARGLGIKVTANGADYEVYQGDLSALDVATLRRETGYSFRGLLTAARTDFDIDVFAALVWLSRRVNGERSLPFAAVADSLDYDSGFDSEDITDRDAPDGRAELDAASRVIEGEVDGPEA